MKPQTFTFSASIFGRAKMRSWIAQLRLDAQEFKLGYGNSDFVITAYDEDDLNAVLELEATVQEYVYLMQERREARRQAELAAERAKRQKKLDRKNFWRKMIFLKPLAK